MTIAYVTLGLGYFMSGSKGNLRHSSTQLMHLHMAQSSKKRLKFQSLYSAPTYQQLQNTVIHKTFPYENVVTSQETKLMISLDECFNLLSILFSVSSLQFKVSCLISLLEII